MGGLLLYYTLGSDPALWPARERREGEHIMIKEIIHIVGANAPKGTFRPYQLSEPQPRAAVTRRP